MASNKVGELSEDSQGNCLKTRKGIVRRLQGNYPKTARELSEDSQGNCLKTRKGISEDRKEKLSEDSQRGFVFKTRKGNCKEAV